MQATLMSHRTELAPSCAAPDGHRLPFVRLLFPGSSFNHGRNCFTCGRSSPNNQEGDPGRLVVFKFRLVALVVFLLLAMLPAANAQSVTGQISGVVVDQIGALIPGATVQLTHDLSQTVHKYTTESNGSFTFTGLIPGAYSLRVAQAGFKGYDQKGITDRQSV